MTYPCPYCRSVADEFTGCPGCGRGPDPNAVEVVKADAEIAGLNIRMTAARQGVAALERELLRVWTRRNEAAARVRAAAMPVSVPVSGPPVAPVTPRRTREASTRLVQNALFLLGGLLLAVAAIVFTAVAWAQFGIGGRALLLAGFTALALGVPLLALRRGLTATAETFAAVGLLLVLLDGYAAWYVNLFGVAAFSPYGYAGAVAAVTAAVAAGYEHHTGLIGPRFAALVVAQPVLPLLVTPLHPDAAGWSFTLSAVAFLDLAVVHLRPVRVTPVGITAYGLGFFSCVVAAASAVTALAEAGGPATGVVGGAALVTAALLPAAGARLARSATIETYATGALVVAVGAAGARVADLAGGQYSGVLVAAVLAVLALAVAALPPSVRPGPRAGALIVTAVPALLAVDAALKAAGDTVAGTVPGDWRTVATVALLTVAAAALLPRWIVLPVGATVMVPTVPGALSLPWSAAGLMDLVAVAVALVLAVGAVPVRSVRVGTSLRLASPLLAGAAALLAGHAVLVGLGRIDLAAMTFGALVLLGVGTAAVARRTGREWLGGAALTVGMLAVPAGAAAIWSRPANVRAWAVLAAVAVLVAVLHLVARAWPGYRRPAAAAAMLAAATVPVWAILAGQPVSVLAGIALVLVALALPAAGRVAAGAASVPLGVTALAASAPGLFSVLVLPLAWVSRIWAGHPGGTGLDPFGFGRVTAAEVAGIALLGLAGALAAGFIAGWRAAVRVALPALLWVVPMTLAAAGVAWPVVPFVSAALGLAILSMSGTGGFGAAGTGLRLAAAVPLAIAGVAGSLPTRAATLAALGAVVVAGAVTGVAGRWAAVRTAGWLAAVPAAYSVAFTAGQMSGLALRTTAFVVLGVAAIALALRPSIVVEVAAHAGAAVALLLTIGSPRYAAAVLALWGLAVGVRALRPVSPARVVAAAACELGGWWLLMASASVAVLEAYTLPAAAVALLAGTLALRARPKLNSWTTHGPALAAALLPTLASVLTGDGHPLRRLLLGAGALVVVLAGAHVRRQAPVVLGGAVLALVALHELALVWDLVPRWIPLAAAGLLLVGLAMTLERRRRDLARFRAALTRMS